MFSIHTQRHCNALSCVASLGAAALVLAGCGSVEEQTGSASPEAGEAADSWQAPEGLTGELTYYSANPQGLTDELVSAFEDKTEVKVNIFAGTTGEITAKLTAEEANPKADVVYLASWSAASTQDSSGALMDYTPAGSEAVDAKWVAPSGAFTGRDGSALALVANTQVVDDAPQTWADLADPKYKDKVIMPDPRESGTAADLIAAMVSSWGEDETWELFDKLFANGLIVQGANGPALDQVTSGSRGVVLGGVDYSAYSAKAKGEPLDVVIPSDGTTVTPRPVMILRSTDNADAAKAFVDFMFSGEAQRISAEKNMIPGNTDIAPKNGPELAEITQLDDDWEKLSNESKDVKETFVKRYLDK